MNLARMYKLTRGGKTEISEAHFVEVNGTRRRLGYSVEGGAFAFVPIPNVRSFWIRTSVAVLYVDCPACKSKRYEPCKNGDGNYHSATHWERRKAAPKGKRGLP